METGGVPMRVGIALPHVGPTAGPRALADAATRAEALGYDSLWVADRLLYPLAPQTPYPATADGVLPSGFRRVLDPLETLTYVAALTRRIALGTSVLDIPYYNPVVLARRLTTLDVLSGGRLHVGLGLGWSKDEFDATGASFADLGRRADEFLAVLKAIWTTDPVEFAGRYYRVPRSVIEPKPVQRPHPPVYLAAFAPAALRRVATVADGWNPTAIPIPAMGAMMADLRRMAAGAGRDPRALRLVVRANVYLGEAPLGADRAPFAGDAEQIGADVAAVRALRADELFFDPNFSPGVETPERFLACMERLRRLV